MGELRDELQAIAWRTADGEPVSREPPYGVAVVVTRPDGAVLLLHRTGRGEREWAWGPPAGARLPGEAVEECARRELREETGLALDPNPVGAGGDWCVFVAEAPAEAEVRLSDEHDAHAWLPLEEAVARCRPPLVAEQLRAAVA